MTEWGRQLRYEGTAGRRADPNPWIEKVPHSVSAAGPGGWNIGGSRAYARAGVEAS
jgi:hypothetical protein